MSKKTKKNIFAGADDVYLTKNHVAVRNVETTYGKNGELVLTDTTTYHKKTKRNMDLLAKTHGKVRYGR